MAPVKHFRIINLHEGDRHTFRCGAKYVVQKVNGKLRLVEEVETEKPPTPPPSKEVRECR